MTEPIPVLMELNLMFSWPDDSLKLLVHPYNRTLEMSDILYIYISMTKWYEENKRVLWLKMAKGNQMAKEWAATLQCDLSTRPEIVALKLKSEGHKRIRISLMTISGPSLKPRAKQLRHWDRNKLVQWAWSWHGWEQWTRGRVLGNTRFVRWPRAGSHGGG